MDLTRRQFGKMLASATAALALPIGFVLKEPNEVTVPIDNQFYVSFTLPRKKMTKLEIEKFILTPALLALNNHLKVKKVNRIGKLTIRKIYDINNDEEVYRIDAFATSKNVRGSRYSLKQLSRIDIRKLKIGQEITTV